MAAHTGRHTDLLRGGGQVLVVASQLAAQHQAAFVFIELAKAGAVRQFLTPSLQREVGLTMGNHRLGRIAVLHDEVAGIAGEAHVLDRASRAGANLDHFGDVTEMVGYGVAGLRAGLLRLLHHTLKISPVLVLQQWCQVAREPKLAPVVALLANALERLGPYVPR